MTISTTSFQQTFCSPVENETSPGLSLPLLKSIHSPLIPPTMTLLTSDHLRIGQGYDAIELRKLLKDGAMQPVRGPNWPPRKELVEMIIHLGITVEEVEEWRRTKRVIARFWLQEGEAGGGDDGDKAEVEEDEEEEDEEVRDMGFGYEEDLDDGDVTVSARPSPLLEPFADNPAIENPDDSDPALHPSPLDDFNAGLLAALSANPPKTDAQIAAILSSPSLLSTTGSIPGVQTQVQQTQVPAPPPPPPSTNPSASDPNDLNLAPFDPNVPSLANISRNPWHPFENRADAEEADPFGFDSYGVFERNEGKP